jgi:hypothetical protein
VTEEPPDPGVTAGGRDGDEAPPGWLCDDFSDTIATSTRQFPDIDSVLEAGLGAWEWPRLVAWAARGWRVDSFELRYEPGAVAEVAGVFRGVLVAEGDVLLRAGASVLGVVVARGALRAEGRGAWVFGVAIARVAALDPGAPAGALSYRYSSCAVNQALSRLFPFRPLEGRSFAYLP